MKYLLILIYTILPLQSSYAGSLSVGKPVPSFKIKTMDGQVMTPATSKGHVLIINLWATWCEPCRKEMPAIDAFYRKYHDQGVDVIAVSLDDRSDLGKVKAVTQSFAFPVGMEKDADIDGFGRIWRVPVTFIIDTDGILRRNGWEGEPLVDMDILEKSIKPLLGSTNKTQ
ncbi:TlpA family protein disulfide reductase [Methyloradius palustris]|uniref:Thioredoxin domain-containing protein n=1 Tax=Methyloradius palustris TaxID=2778876 RepID=A0A8D5GA79_9PROT|nr:TlpA disulfide reductase family protein [Methyloradius palustris]BCM24496.1 hypothetical protein ZMTM_07550 [Methyloradius palustris]